ncbi:hypothetical protein EZV62_014504 [Acer yangbiense]|uniref:Pentacotripeptide-repeat region of PRORP domain-containing protein n=1 Tax=Acer yangbiense TaxID=1000413 RepID=A0A5C7HSC9_9ROSI|nr:hypothetical protein EZV62_014504 [Acer yangbiense]
METRPVPLQLSAPKPFEPNIDKIKHKLLQHGVFPTPKILRNIRKKEIQKHKRKLAKIQSNDPNPPLTESQQQALDEEEHFHTLKREYKHFTRAITAKNGDELIGKPWERIERLKFRELASGSKEFVGHNLKKENLRELKQMFEEDLNWVLDNDIQLDDDYGSLGGENREFDPAKRWRSEADAIRVLVDRLSAREITLNNWKFVRIMKQSGLQFSESQLLKIVEGLGCKGSWRPAMSVVEWVYGRKEQRDLKSRFVYTKLMAILGKARRPQEVLDIFNLMLIASYSRVIQEDCIIYPDMAAYRSAAVTLGQAGLLKELMKLIESMRQKPSKRIKNIRSRNWDPVLEPDLVVYNAVLNACVPSHQWKGVFWVFKQLRKSGLKPNGATYGLAMEVMLQSGKYDLVHEFFSKMKRSGEALRAITYKVLVRAFWEEGKINEAVQAVRDMERRGVVGTASVYYELACCLCNNCRWEEAMVVVEKMKQLPHSKPLEITFTGLIISSMDGGHVDECISIFQRMKDHCKPNIGTINTMLKVYGKNDMFSKAKELFEEATRANSYSTSPGSDATSLKPDEYTYSSMLEASARAHQWEYFEYVYKGMALSGYQLDQTKHVSLLVEASKAGKCNLLEHAFDTLLEAGEIPHPLFFTEMLIQVTAQSNYGKAVTLVNTMAYAPFQISVRQWTELFEKNKDRLGLDNLKKLLNALYNCDATSEITVSNLSRSLQSLCGSGKERDFSRPTFIGSQVTDISPLDGNNEGFDVDRTENVLSSPASVMVLESATYISSNNQQSSLCTSVDDVDDDASYDGYSDYLENELSILNLNGGSEDSDDDEELQMPMSKDSNSHELKLPSANEILETWKESRNKDW